MSEHDSSTQVLEREAYDDAAPRSVKVTHLVVGLVFLGIATIWAVNTRADDWGNVTYFVPAMLVGAGVLGLVASVAGSRRRRSAAERAGSAQHAEAAAPTEPTEPTTLITDEEDDR